MEKIVLLFLCGIGAIRDIKTRTVWIPLWAAAAMAGAVWNVVWRGRDLYWIALSVLVGLALIALSGMMGGQIGMGDGVAFLVIGLWSGVSTSLTILWYSLLFCGAWIFLRRIQRKIKPSDSVPFLPFVFLGVAAQWIWS